MASQSPLIIAGIDMGSSTTRVVITEHTETDAQPRVIGIGKMETMGISKGYVVHEAEAVQSLLQAITRAEKMAGVQLERAYISIGGISLETHHITTQIELTKREITDRDISMLRYQVTNEFSHTTKNKTILHAIPLRFTLDDEELFADPIGLSGNVLSAEFSLVTCLTQHRDGLVSVVSAAGIDIIDIVASPIAASVIALPKRARTAGAALVDIGSETLSLSVFEHDALVHVAVIPCGSSLITNDLALGLQISLEEAESLKANKQTEKVPVSKRKVLDIIEARIMDMLEIIQRRLISWSKDRLLPGGITIIGGGSNHENIDTYVRTFLKLPAQVLETEKLIPSKKGLDNGWFSAYGLCLLGDQQPTYRTSGITIKKFLKDTQSGLKSFIEQFLP
jgi:cell division protein FtsA